MRRKRYLLYVILCVMLLLNGCGSHVVEMPSAIYTIMKHNDITQSQIYSLGDYSKFEIELAQYEISDEEVNKYIDIQLESFAQIVPIIDRKTVQNGDVVYISYMAYQNDVIINQVEHDSLVVGSGYYNQRLESMLIGQTVGVPFKMTLTDENGKAVELNITIESINYFETYELMDKFVQEKLGYKSVEEYYNSCMEKLKIQKADEEKRKCVKELFENIIFNSMFYIDEYEIAQYSTYLIAEQEKYASVYDLDLNSYITQILNMTVEEFYEKYYDYGEYEIKKYLVVGAIFNDLNYIVDEEEYLTACEKMKYNYNDAKEDSYTDALINYHIMEEKVIDFFIK